jgi:predicted kinase
MDLVRLGRPQAAESFVEHYRGWSDDSFPPSLVDFYCASRAYVRALVGCLRFSQGAGCAAEEANEFHRLALEFLQRAQVTAIVVGGLPGTGKSTLTRGIGQVFDVPVLSSDEVRRETYGFIEASRPAYASGRYGQPAKDDVYRELMRRAEYLLGIGYSVVLDASWIDAQHRCEIRAVAERTSSEVVELQCATTPTLATQRIVARQAAQASASEATPQIYSAMRAMMDPWPSALVIDTSGTSAASLARATEMLSLTPRPHLGA